MALTELGTTPSRRTFEDFHARRAGDALRYAAAIVGPREAEDACQEAWLRI
jgi:DNA-directed RNA polymerase specialized sigma24 family protein